MVSSKAVLAAVGLGAALLAPSACAQDLIGRDSIARCSFTGRGLGGSMSDEVAVTVVETVTAYVCNSTEVNTAQANVTAQEVATATAFAIASVTARCYANGRASFRLNGRSLVEAEAVAIASSVVSLVLESDACGTCNIATELFAEAYTEIILQASALAQANLEGDAAGTPVVALANDLIENIVNASATAYASVLGTVQAAVGQGCNATALFSVGDLGADGAVCSIDVTAANNSVAMDAVAEIFVDLEAEACDSAIANTNINVTVEAIASAQAVALAQISTSCVITGDASVCAFSTAEVNATAMATAESFAFLYAAARSTCDPPVCEVDTSILTEAFSTVLSAASASAVLNQCSSEENVFNFTVFEEQIQESTLTALASIIANVTVVNGAECIVDIPVIESAILESIGTPMNRSSPPIVTPSPSPSPSPSPTPSGSSQTDPVPSVPAGPVVPPPSPDPPATPTLPNCFSGSCVANNRRCFGTSTRFGDTPATCCDPNYVCLRRNARFSQCRRASAAVPRGWDGTIEQCIAV